MISPVSFRNSIFISVVGHITVFSIFGLSFGNRIPKAEYSNVYFWGQFLQSYQVAQTIPNNINHLKRFLTRKPDTSALDKINPESVSLSEYYLKPTFILAFNSEKEIFIERTESLPPFPKRAKPAIIFHPLLPYGFTLYFQDRQVAHVELRFKIVSEGKRNSTLIKRKISSGNLEVDLMAMRYIGHYLFIQQTNFTPNNWQTVKIDLSAKND